MHDRKTKAKIHVFVFLWVCAIPCSCTSPSDRRRHTLASPGRRSGCPILRRCTRTGCTAGNMEADNARLLLSTTRQAERGASRVCRRFMLHQTIKLHFKMKMLPLSSHSQVSANIKFSPGEHKNKHSCPVIFPFDWSDWVPKGVKIQNDHESSLNSLFQQDHQVVFILLPRFSWKTISKHFSLTWSFTMKPKTKKENLTVIEQSLFLKSNSNREDLNEIENLDGKGSRTNEAKFVNVLCAACCSCFFPFKLGPST